MKHLTLAQSLNLFQTLFSSAKHQMFKAEVLQDYSAVDDCPSLRAWLSGNKEKARELGSADPNIIDYRNACLKSPAKITRVHVVASPFTPYLAWEIAVCYKDSLLAHNAESILLTPYNHVADLELPDGDFWIFDNARVLQWQYTQGKTSGALLWDIAAGDDVNHFMQLKQALLAQAVPVEGW
ncbi:MAG TPA: hypothetical protein VFO38_03090 [Candidatus Saccharimonadales bacterium]|nr:hypothetical protein [Candidatus Saccharimonadales bacterium]